MQRAKKNSIDLFPELIGHRVSGIRQYENERSFALLLEHEKSLLFKMHGNRSNIILFHGSQPVNLFKSSSPGDTQLQPAQLDRRIDWSYAAFLLHHDNPAQLYFTFGKVVWEYLSRRGYESLTQQLQYELIMSTVKLLEKPEYFLIRLKNSVHLSLLPFEGSRQLSGTPCEISNTFYYAFTHEFVLENEKNAVISKLKSRLLSSQNYYEKNFQKLAEIESDTNYKIWADMIMANLHALNQGLDKVSLPDFYQPEKSIEIKLRKDLNPQGNATLYYKKAKNQHIEINKIQEALKKKEQEIERLKQVMAELIQINDLKTFRQKVGVLGINRETEKQLESAPYHEFWYREFRILVGKNAEANDEVTFRLGYKEDLWLHAKDVSGSHVLIKYQSGKKFPKDVIERAAELAAYNSKRKTETLCPVIVTLKKYVRKRKGDPAGAVVVEREEVIMVVPKL